LVHNPVVYAKLFRAGSLVAAVSSVFLRLPLRPCIPKPVV
jgi:hypothetical protein